VGLCSDNARFRQRHEVSWHWHPLSTAPDKGISDAKNFGHQMYIECNNIVRQELGRAVLVADLGTFQTSCFVLQDAPPRDRSWVQKNLLCSDPRVLLLEGGRDWVDYVAVVIIRLSERSTALVNLVHGCRV
jgi:hypothetical protein